MSGSSWATAAVAGRRKEVATSAQSQRMRALPWSGARGWLGERGRLAVAGWLRLLRQDQLAGPRDAEPVLFAPVPDHQFSSTPEEIGAAHGRMTGTLVRWPIGGARHGQRERGVTGSPAAARAGAGRNEPASTRKPAPRRYVA